jgi:UDP-N-acetylmuramate--alanine ligase
MGIGGVGMCGLAEVLLGRGAIVSGCDVSDSERTDRLRRLGATISLGHDPAHLDGVDALVMTAAVRHGEAELERARGLGMPVVRRAELLAELMRGRRGVAVAGTHGKTTTTALVGHLLTAAGLDPTVIVGGRARFLESHARLGGGEVMVCEADEFDRAFLELGSEIAVITNVEPEHLECYGDAAGLDAAFALFANRVSTFGAVVLCTDDPGASALRPAIRRRVIGYGLNDGADLRARDVVGDAGGSAFDVWSDGESIGTVRSPQPGLHFVRNSLAAIAVGRELGIPFDVLAGALETFPGVARRFDRRGDRDGVTVIDDYAHHPTEIRAVVAAARQAFPERRLVAVFQPHLYSRTRDFATDFGRSLTGADLVVVLPIYPARELPIDGVDAALVVAAATDAGQTKVMVGPAVEDAAAALDEWLRPGDVLLTLGAGDVWRVAEEFLAGGGA